MTISLETFSLVPSELPYIAFGFVFAYQLSAILSKVLLRPFQELIEAREARSTGAVADAEVLTRKAIALEEAVQERLAFVRVEAGKAAAARIIVARDQASHVIAKAEAIADSVRREARTNLGPTVQSAQKAYKERLPNLVDVATDKLLALH